MKSLQELVTLNNPEFCLQFYDYLIEKINAKQPLHEFEEVSYLLLTMKLDIEMEGFIDLFYQLYSLRECRIVEENLRKFGFNRLADLFVEAKNLYIGGKSDITEEEYRDIDPFDNEDSLRSLDEIGEQIMAEGSGIYLIGERVCEYARANTIRIVQEQSA